MSEKSKSFAPETNRRADASTLDTVWLKWKDSDLNNEKWGIPKDGADGSFLDTECVVLPTSLGPYEWTRARDLKHLTGPLTVYTETAIYPDLVTSNKHLLNSEFVRWFICALVNLQYCGREALEISGENSDFVWTNRHNPWHGWMHVYSLNKAGKGVQHRPVINPNGKYIVRLHCMGCWRRILVDDTIPVDKGGRPLLPCTSNNFELWPMLLAKALLKVASQTWTERREIIDFHPIACLTGWTCLTLKIQHLSLQDKWDLLTKYSERFEWTSQTQTPENSKNLAENPRETPRSASEIEKSQPITLFLLLDDTRGFGSDAVPGLSPCWDHVIYVVQSRDVPLDPNDVKEPLARWKMHRWLKWAISQNVIDPVDYFMPIRYLEVSSPLKECSESIRVDNEHDIESKSVPSRVIQQANKSAWEAKSEKISDPFTTTKEEATKDISRWIDFIKLAPYIIEVHLFYKLEYFQCSIQVTGDISRMTTSGDPKATITKETKKEKEDVYDWSSQNPKSRIRPLYLSCDSLERKFLLINLCAAPKEKNINSYQIDYLILEKHNWFLESDQTDQSITVSTTGTKSTILELEAGRQLLRVYRSSESSLVTISCNTAFCFGNRMTVQQAMTSESERIKQMSKEISNNLRAAYQSFGTRDYPVMLKNYYRSYMPILREEPSENTKHVRMLIHHSFMEEQIRLIREAFPKEELENILSALRIFFLDPDIRLEYFDLVTDREIVPNFVAQISEDHRDTLGYTQKATTIQSFFKMARVKGYKDLHSPNHPLHTQIYKELQKISDLFDVSFTSRLLRNVINRHRNLRDLYPCAKDFAHVLNMQELKGVLGNVRHEQWFPIVRLIVNLRPAETAFAIFEPLSGPPHIVLRVFSNQDRREMPRFVNHVAAARYEYLPTGYTMFAYGRSEKQQRFKEHEWAIRVITTKGESMLYQLAEQQPLSPQTKLPKLAVEELIGTYVPNIRNCISRWILKAAPGSIVSIRLATSYSLAEIRMRITDEEGDVLVDTRNGYTILLPVLILKPLIKHEVKERHQGIDEDSRDTVQEKSSYYIEAFVLNDSWPLTDAEWTVVNQTKMDITENLEKTQVGNKVSSRSNSLRKNLRQSVNDDQALGSPYWNLQVVTDTRDAVEVCQDKRREEEIVLLKESWWSRHTDRRTRGKELREAFLNTYVSKIEPEAFLSQNKRQSRTMEDEDMVFSSPNARQRRTLKSPGSYYLPPLDLTRYTRANEIAKHRRIKTRTDDEILRNQHVVDIGDSQRNHSNYLDKLAELMNEQLQRYTKFFTQIKEGFRQRRILTDAAYESRKIYIDSLASDRAKAKEKKGKKD